MPDKFYGQQYQDEKITMAFRNLHLCQFTKIIEDINKRNLYTIKNKCSPLYIVVSKEMYIYLKKNSNNKFNF